MTPPRHSAHVLMHAIALIGAARPESGEGTPESPLALTASSPVAASVALPSPRETLRPRNSVVPEAIWRKAERASRRHRR